MSFCRLGIQFWSYYLFVLVTIYCQQQCCWPCSFIRSRSRVNKIQYHYISLGKISAYSVYGIWNTHIHNHNGKCCFYSYCIFWNTFTIFVETFSDKCEENLRDIVWYTSKSAICMFDYLYLRCIYELSNYSMRHKKINDT